MRCSAARSPSKFALVLDVVAVVEDAALVGTPDKELLAHALAQRLLTANIAGFAAIAIDWRGAGRGHAGLVYVTSRAFPQSRSFSAPSFRRSLRCAPELPRHQFCLGPEPTADHIPQ